MGDWIRQRPRQQIDSPTASRLPSFKSLAAASTSCPGWPLRRKLMLRFVVTARPTGPTADNSTTYIAQSASAISVGPEMVPAGRSVAAVAVAQQARGTIGAVD